MLWTLFVSLVFAWFLGVASSLTLHGYIHLFPLMAAVVAVVGTLQRRSLA
jgi:hypothetical protein